MFALAITDYGPRKIRPKKTRQFVDIALPFILDYSQLYNSLNICEKTPNGRNKKCCH